MRISKNVREKRERVGLAQFELRKSNTFGLTICRVCHECHDLYDVHDRVFLNRQCNHVRENEDSPFNISITIDMRIAKQLVFCRITGADFFNIYKAAGQEVGGGGHILKAINLI